MENLFKVNYLTREKDLLKAAFSFSKYKAMPKIPAAILAVIMLPLQIASAVIGAFLFVPSLLLRAVISAIKSLHAVVTDEGQKLKHATQLIVYIISWPIIIASYILAIAWYVQAVVLYLLLECVSYIWSLGGFKFHAYVVDADSKEISVKGKYKKLFIAIFLIVTALLLVVAPILCSTIEFVRTFVNGCEVIIKAIEAGAVTFMEVLEGLWKTLCYSVKSYIACFKISLRTFYRYELLIMSIYSFFVLSRPIALEDENAQDNGGKSNGETKKLADENAEERNDEPKVTTEENA